LNVSLSELTKAVKAHGFEGIVAKRLDSRYEPGQRSGAWLKMRVNQGQEFVIGGYTPGSGSFDALIFGYYEGDCMSPELAMGSRLSSGDNCVGAFRAWKLQNVHSRTCPSYGAA